VTAPGRALAILDAGGRVLASRWSGLEPRDVLRLGDHGLGVRTTDAGGRAWRVHASTHSFGDLKLVLLVASPVADMLREQQEVQEAMLVGIPIVLLLAGAGGLWLASIGLRPITEMARRAASIPSTGLEDLGQTQRTDELGQLATAFNGLVARLRAALQTQRQFTADASHELRTPVSVVRATSDVMLSREHRDEPEYREAIAIVGGQARRLGRLVEDMLVLARADAGGYPLQPVDLYLDEVVAECRRAVDVLATERGVTIRSNGGPDIPFRGDEDLLRRLVLNVLQNAVQHTPSGGSVAVDIKQERDEVRIRVTDEGHGIPPDDQRRIFDRFVQLDPARRGQGTGLGLPIARWIAEAHRGTLVLERSGPQGTTFCVSLPTGAAG
jgi:heavy metal sensor kinase